MLPRSGKDPLNFPYLTGARQFMREPMLSIVLIGGVLVAVTVAVHAAGITVLLKALKRWYAILPTRFWRITRLLVVMTWWLVLLHLAEISVWGLFYLWWGCLPDAEAALYFSGVTYTPLATAIWYWRSRGGCSHRSRA